MNRSDTTKRVKHKNMQRRNRLSWTFAFSFIALISMADEGMWLPQLLNAMNIKDMKKNGCKLTAEQIYSINKSSLKDAIVQFGGGCTAEVISSEGLILTNHHCGYSSIAYHSTVQNDYLTNGFVAMNKQQELYTPNLTATIINRIEDVTAKVLNGITSTTTDVKKDSIIKANIKAIEKAAVEGTHYEAFVRPFFYGNDYYLFVTEVFKDIRMVFAPPSSIGKFGGETDNWMWPRHNADFSVFRIYANKDNKPAEFSNDNVPYKPKHVIPISLKGYKEGDFTMVYGFPGRTQEYLTSYAVDMIMNESDPLKVSLREKRLAIYEADMRSNDTIRIAYANKYASVANYYKKWMGEMLGLKKYDALSKKQAFEQQFNDALNQSPDLKTKYANLLPQLKEIYKDYRLLNRQMDYYSECLLAIDVLNIARGYSNLFAELKKKQKGTANTFDKNLADLKKSLSFKNYNRSTDMKICEAMLGEYIRSVKHEDRPAVLDSMITAQGNDAHRLTEFLYSNTTFSEKNKIELMLNDLEKYPQLYERDPVYYLATSIVKHYSKNIIPQFQSDDFEINELQKQYVTAQKELIKTKKFYPDANSTLRVAYGKVSSYKPRDGVNYEYYTTIDGIMEKYKAGDEEFNLPPKLIDLYKSKDYGQYADASGSLHVAFTGSNHTTGGNSGSPVFNGKGELIGTNFDRNWEGTMSDIMYNPAQCRNIALDVRYTLFIIDKFGGAGYLLNEMKIMK
ncbi:MAG: S46 family peptidase [Bacteroidetes bacterium]|nr:S46 family peptidase [Bacteroidota bacterium]